MNFASFFVGIVVWFIIFLILRGFNCWYWKINKIVSLLEEINKKLDNDKPDKEQPVKEQQDA